MVNAAATTIINAIEILRRYKTVMTIIKIVAIKTRKISKDGKDDGDQFRFRRSFEETKTEVRVLPR